MSGIAPDQICLICNGSARVGYRSFNDRTLVFQPHYKPGTIEECTGAGLEFLASDPIKPSPKSKPEKVELKACGIAKCYRCKREMQVIVSSAGVHFPKHNFASGGECAGSFEAVPQRAFI